MASPSPAGCTAAAAGLLAAAHAAKAGAAAARACGLLQASSTAVAAAEALLAASVLTGAGDPEVELRLDTIREFLTEEVRAGVAGRRPLRNGRSRAARNVAEH